MSPRTTGILLLILAAGSAAFRLAGWSVPVFKLPDLAGEAIADLASTILRLILLPFGVELGAWKSGPAVCGWIVRALLVLPGILCIRMGRGPWPMTPMTRRKLQRFRAIRRGYISFCILLAFVFVACLDNLVVGSRALIVKHDGHMRFPLVEGLIPASTFGGEGESETDYRELRDQFREAGQGNWVLMPPVPYAPKLDSSELKVGLEERSGLLYLPGKDEPFNGRAYTSFKSKPSQKRQEWTFRRGQREGEMQGWDESGELIERGRFEKGQRTAYTDLSEGKAAALADAGTSVLKTIIYPPAPPNFAHSHFLGTNSTGGDIVAILFGGLQQAIVAVVLFLIFTLTTGVTIGGVLGYFGGWTDLLGQRLIEIWSNLPYLFIVIIIASLIQPSLLILVLVMAAFSWMSPTTYMRTAAYKEKARDYVAAARLIGAGPARIIFLHVMPNAISTLVTLAPFLAASVITSLAALDFLGFGLPPEDPSWGRLLHEGTDNFNYPWIVIAAFTALAACLILITFVGEAVREAFDPKKFTTYQ